MAQLKDDCFAFGGELTPVEEALQSLEKRLVPAVETERVQLGAALGRILAQDVVSDRNVPPHDNSAVDGYAVFHADLKSDGETRMPVNGRVAAGHPLDRPAERGEAVRIFTGAPMPDGMETVFMEEDCALDGDEVVLPTGLKEGSNRRKCGEDVRQGDVIVRAGQVLRPQDIGLAASVGVDSLSVYHRLRIAVFSTGDEVRDPSGEAADGSIFDSNRFSVMGLLEGLGCRITDLGILPDDEDAIAEALGAAAPDHDLLITSGGVSAGEEDHVKAAVERQGSLYFWRLAIKPGRPIALGQVGETAFVGLPGNPVAAMVTFVILARPIILRLGGAKDTNAWRYSVTAAFDYKKKMGRREWVRVSLSRSEDGHMVARKFHSSGAGILTSMAAADGLVELPEDVTRVSEGDDVQYLPFSEVL